MIVAETDTIAPIGPALRVADRAPKSQLYRSRGGHYGPYKGGEGGDNVVRVEVEFPASTRGILRKLSHFSLRELLTALPGPCPRTFHGTLAR
jgi:hypothetical protein